MARVYLADYLMSANQVVSDLLVSISFLEEVKSPFGDVGLSISDSSRDLLSSF